MKPTIESKKAELNTFYTHLKETGYNLKGCTCLIVFSHFFAVMVLILELELHTRCIRALENFECDPGVY